VAIELQPGEQRIGFALAGVPHLVVLVDDVEAVDLMHRGALLRRHPAAGEAGANVNFVAARPDGTWRYRTFERGVEGETLACGTGSIGTAILLVRWGLAQSPVTIRTTSGRQLIVTLRETEGRPGEFQPSLKGEGRIVYRGRIDDLSGRN
jgi:diaminopimelate epimerase